MADTQPSAGALAEQRHLIDEIQCPDTAAAFERLAVQYAPCTLDVLASYAARLEAIADLTEALCDSLVGDTWNLAHTIYQVARGEITLAGLAANSTTGAGR